MPAAYRADSCFIELVYNVRWMEHINRFKFTSFPPCPPPPPQTAQKRERGKIRKSEREKTENPLLTQRYNECLFHRCHLSTTACFVTYKRGGERRRGEAGVERDWDFQGSSVITSMAAKWLVSKYKEFQWSRSIFVTFRCWECNTQSTYTLLYKPCAAVGKLRFQLWKLAHLSSKTSNRQRFQFLLLFYRFPDQSASFS